MKYCAKKECCTHDVIAKLEAWDVPEAEREFILQRLVSEIFVDDARYARLYVSEKWILNLWGRIKIVSGLKQKNLDEKIISDALQLIDEKEYLNVLRLLISKKWTETTAENAEEKKRSALMYALNKGFEEELILEIIETQIAN